MDGQGTSSSARANHRSTTEKELEGSVPPRFYHYWSCFHQLKDTAARKFGKRSDLELAAVGLSGFIRNQADWPAKLDDPDTATWVSGAEGLLRSLNPEKPPTKFEAPTVQYVVDELKYYREAKGQGLFEVGTADGTWMADSLLSEQVRNELVLNAGLLEDSIPVQKREMYSDEPTAWNPIHPSMFPFVAGVTKVLKEPFTPTRDEAEGTIHLFEYYGEDAFFSAERSRQLAFRYESGGTAWYVPNMCRSHHWLPSEFKVADDLSVSIESYINNLHPEGFPELYSLIEGVFKEMIPLFQKVLMELKLPRGKRWRLDDGKEYVKPKSNDIKHFPACNLTGRRLQVITQLTSIDLSPGNPQYSGGVFRNVGMSNEMIVAVGVYFYSCNNIVDSKVEFLQKNGCCRFFGNQIIGDTLVKTGRCVVFPNTLQSRDTAFKLADPSRPGHRKSLLFFLVDPGVRVVSTSHVPPQQKSWFLAEILKEPVGLPDEIVELILDQSKDTLSLQQANTYRQAMATEMREKAEEVERVSNANGIRVSVVMVRRAYRRAVPEEADDSD